MKFATVNINGRSAVAMVSPDSDQMWPIELLVGRPVTDMVDLIQHFQELRGSLQPKGSALSLSSAKLEAPIRQPRNILCIGKNYDEHAREFTISGFDNSANGISEAIPSVPIVFTKSPGSVIGDGECITYPRGLSNCVDYEAELGVIIGKSGRGITREQAYNHVWGYTIINDMTARDLQSQHKQWFLGKSLDTFCPMGPWIVTSDEVDPTSLEVRSLVNGELRQNGNTRDLIFDIPRLIETLSAGMTLIPGDVIATGTPAGVGIGFNPPRYLHPGDVVIIEISGIGRLTNQII
jgi:2-keto-4-pentenoate hydratase/2-oxohepta-3-ene-1,7-dioic acid hydratase in catechol pathway